MVGLAIAEWQVYSCGILYHERDVHTQHENETAKSKATLLVPNVFLGLSSLQEVH